MRCSLWQGILEGFRFNFFLNFCGQFVQADRWYLRAGYCCLTLSTSVHLAHEDRMDMELLEAQKAKKQHQTIKEWQP